MHRIMAQARLVWRFRNPPTSIAVATADFGISGHTSSLCFLVCFLDLKLARGLIDKRANFKSRTLAPEEGAP